MKKNFLALGTCAFALALGLAACGDDSGSNSGTNGVKGEVIALADGSGEKVCDEKLEGWVAEAVGKDFRRCQNGEWTKITASEASAEDEIIGGVTVLRSSSSETILSSSSSVLSDMSSSSSTPTEDSGSSSSVKAPEQVGEPAEGSSSSATPSSSSSVIPSEVEGSCFYVVSSFSFESSSSVVSSSSEKSSSSVASSSSAKSSSSVASSSSAKSSSSVASSSSAKSSSSKANWAYLNPSIDYGTMIDARDGQVYKTVTIGTQTWMAENLNYNPGYVSSMGIYAWSGCYDNERNCSKYGRLYTWEVAMKDASCAYGKSCNPSGIVQGVCPDGWHLPSNDEWKTLFTYVGGTSTAGRKLKSTSGWNSGHGTDSFGFAVLPAGRRVDGGFDLEGNNAYFWSSTEYNSNRANRLYFGYDSDSVNNYWIFKHDGFSVRCLRDSDEGSVATSSSSQAKPSNSSSSTPTISSSSTPLEDPGSSKANWAYLNPSIDYGEFTDARDGQTYKTVTIGTQTWMAENLNYNPGNVSSMGSYAWSGCYDNESTNCSKYGRLYTWEVAMDNASCAYGNSCNRIGRVQGVCPDGWHLPNDTEWNTLWTAAGDAGKKLRSTSGWNSRNGTDSFGFAVLPAGYRRYDGVFGNEGGDANFWSSTEYSSNGASGWNFLYNDVYVGNYGGSKYDAFSVRCLRNSN